VGKVTKSDNLDIVEAQPEKQWVVEASERAKAKTRHPLKIVLFNDGSGEERFQIKGTNQEKYCSFVETTGFTDKDAAHRLIQQISNAQKRSKEISVSTSNSAMAFINGIAPETPLEGLLAAQMTVAHNLAMEFAERAMVEGQTADGVDRNINRVTKMMRAFSTQAETLQKLRNKGQQKITVQHVQVGHGGQAIIGDVHQGEGNRA
jgi:hypothetical protein